MSMRYHHTYESAITIKNSQCLSKSLSSLINILNHFKPSVKVSLPEVIWDIIHFDWRIFIIFIYFGYFTISIKHCIALWLHNIINYYISVWHTESTAGVIGKKKTTNHPSHITDSKCGDGNVTGSYNDKFPRLLLYSFFNYDRFIVFYNELLY